MDGNVRTDLNYVEWMAAHVPRDPGFVLGMCHYWSSQMQRVFPELELRQGTVRFWDEWDSEWHSWAHWWLVTPDGQIVDPTAHQFPPIERYECFDEQPSGRCHECGEYFSGEPRDFCNSGCAGRYVAMLNGGKRE